jgi:hypothetical protein
MRVRDRRRRGVARERSRDSIGIAEDGRARDPTGCELGITLGQLKSTSAIAGAKRSEQLLGPCCERLAHAAGG